MTTTDPEYYRGFSNGAEVIDISENLTANGAQAVQYIARSTRQDGRNKPDEVDSLRKAIWFIEREIVRLGGSQPQEPASDDGPWELHEIPEGVDVVDRDGDVWTEHDVRDQQRGLQGSMITWPPYYRRKAKQ